VSFDTLLDAVRARSEECDHPLVVGVSGYAGSGKSTLVRALVDRIEGAVRMRGDDFLDPARSHHRSADWDGVERVRLTAEVLEPFRLGLPSSFRRFDWSTRALGELEPVPIANVMFVDLIGLFHPEALPLLDVKIWCDVDLDTAKHRGMRRDDALGRDHARLWNEVWIPNERDFDAGFRPRDKADLLYTPRGS
jgi:hypothetical protein